MKMVCNHAHAEDLFKSCGIELQDIYCTLEMCGRDDKIFELIVVHGIPVLC